MVLLACLTLVTGCATEGTQKRMIQAQSDTQSCIDRIATMKERMANSKITLNNERDKLIFLMVQQMVQQNASTEMSMCDDIAIAQINGQSAKVGKAFALGATGLRVGGLIWGASILADGLTELANPAGSTNGDTFNSYNSRVVNRSSNSSSSGEGMGVGGTFSAGNSQSIGGFESRTLPVNGNVTEVNTGSLSGDNAPITPPVEVQPLPVE